MYRHVLCLFALSFLACSVRGQEKSIDELKIDKVGIKTSRAEFVKLHPTATKEKSKDEEHGVVLYKIGSIKESVSSFEFLDEKLMRMAVFYSSAEAQKAGGYDTLIKGVTKKYGKDDPTSLGLYKDERGRDALGLIWINEFNGNELNCDVRNYGQGVGEMLSYILTVKDVNDTLKAKMLKGKSRIDD